MNNKYIDVFYPIRIIAIEFECMVIAFFQLVT